MVERSMLECDEIPGTYSSPSVSGTGQHREPMRVGDDDIVDMPNLADGAGSMVAKRDNQVDDTAIEDTQGQVCMGPRSLATEAAEGGYSQPGDQSFPESGPREVSGTRGAADIGQIAGHPGDLCADE